MIEGIQNSKYGIIPSGWKLKQFKEVTKTLTDYVASGSFASLKENVTVLDEPNYAVYVRQVDLNSNFKKKLKYVDKKSYDFLKNSNLYSNDIIFTNIGDLGRISIMPDLNKKCTIAPNILLIRANDKFLDQNFYYYLLSSREVQDEIHKIKSGTGLPKINKGDLKQIYLKIPSLLEQQKIAEILSTVDAKIEVIDQQISETKELKKGLMQRLLTKGIGHTEFKDSPLGKIPKSWEVVKLSEVTMKIGDGLHSTPKYVDNSKYYFVNGNNLVNGKLTVSEKTKCVSEDEFLKHNINIDSSSILMSINGTIGNLAFYSGERVVFGKSACFISPRGMKLDRNYLYYYLQLTEVKKYFLNELTGTTIQNLSLKTIRNTPTNLPPIQEQQKIAEILSSVDEKLEVLVEKKVNYQELKQGLMQQLLTGKIRVKV
jgi:type I restriction enzyme S subunit